MTLPYLKILTREKWAKKGSTFSSGKKHFSFFVFFVICICALPTNEVSVSSCAFSEQSVSFVLSASFFSSEIPSLELSSEVLVSIRTVIHSYR